MNQLESNTAMERSNALMVIDTLLAERQRISLRLEQIAAQMDLLALRGHVHNTPGPQQSSRSGDTIGYPINS